MVVSVLIGAFVGVLFLDIYSELRTGLPTRSAGK